MYESGDYPKISDSDMKIAEDNKKKFEVRFCLEQIDNFLD